MSDKKTHYEEDGKVIDVEIISEEEVEDFDNYDHLDEGEYVFYEETDEDDAPTEEIIIESETKKTKNKKTKKVKSKKDKKSKGAKNKMNTIIAIVVLCLVAGGTYFAWNRFFSKEKVDIFEYIEVKYTGVDGSAIAGIEPIDPMTNQDAKDLVDNAIFTFEPSNTGLKNGDKLTVKVKLNSEFEKEFNEKKKLASTSKEYTVDLYSEASTIDPFDGLVVDFSGKQGEGKASVDKSGVKAPDAATKNILSNVEYVVSKDSKLNQGDTVEVSLKYNEAVRKELKAKNMSFKTEKKNYIVEGLAVSPESVKDIENVNDLSKSALDALKNKHAEKGLKAENYQKSLTCYAQTPKLQSNAYDELNGTAFSDGTLMFVYTYQLDGKTYADNMGYTNIVYNNGKIDQNAKILTSPKQEKSSLEKIQGELNTNGFKCD